MDLPISELTVVHQAAMVVLVARDRGAPAFDCVSQKAGWPIVVYG